MLVEYWVGADRSQGGVVVGLVLGPGLKDRRKKYLLRGIKGIDFEHLIVYLKTEFHCIEINLFHLLSEWVNFDFLPLFKICLDIFLLSALYSYLRELYAQVIIWYGRDKYTTLAPGAAKLNM